MWPFGKSTADRVKDALRQTPRLENINLNVEERGGNVTISGEVPNENYHRLIEVVAEGIKGVKQVDVSQVRARQTVHATEQRASQTVSRPAANQQQATPQTASQQNIPDIDDLQQDIQNSQLAKAVLRNLEANVELKDDPIDVLQSGRSVILRGAVDSQHEFNLAEKIARGTSGVASVDTSDLKIVEQAKQKYQEAQASSKQSKPQQGYVNQPDEWYTVKAGDTLSEIAERFYGDASKESYMKIARANGISDPNLIRVGQKLQIPR
ncbi:BON domain-containing protein [Deinococcus cellulosilyticus]|uniref:BON domain-containing protein n=1 Tax=Deinococcus cellulosilyticus (strain DSM 18568 / NBRC 106333 / KACC 11606 / 5516J-15) TaxID=1223518 RepID=A0A511N8X9_DEIC1|nr:BON domain-containing protein [Deinococcus cellulosilyticus]GEM48938.1 hypothetical protein DC3_45730 [Deinococcus cellulosilyticus NBRC 106333 = KACC 11606]